MTNCISVLPNELLATVLQCLTYQRPTPSAWCQARFVCRKWAVLLEPHLFTSVKLSYSFDLFNGSMSGSRVAYFLNILHRKPHLLRHVFELDIDVEKINEWICERVLELLDICSKIKHLRLKFRLHDLQLPELYTRAVNQRFLTILRKVATLNLQDLHLSGVSFESVITVLDNADINHLHLDSSSWSGNKADPAASGNYPLSDYKQSFSSYQRTGKLKHLSMSNVHETPKGVDLLLQWPAGLEGFRFRFVEYPWMSLFPIRALDLHRTTLKTIDLGYLSNPPNPCFLNFSDFPRLENLCISGYDIVLIDGNVLPICVFAPRLRRLEIRFDRFTTVALPETNRDALFDWDLPRRDTAIRRLATWFDFDHNTYSRFVWPGTIQNIVVTYKCYRVRQVGAIYEPAPLPGPDDAKWPEAWLEPAREHGSRLGFTVDYIYDA